MTIFKKKLLIIPVLIQGFKKLQLKPRTDKLTASFKGHKKLKILASEIFIS